MMSAPRRVKIPACALVGVIASIDELRLATRMRAPPDLFELRLDHLPNLRESQLLKLRVPAKPAPMCSKLSLEPKTFVICSLYSSCCGTSLRECAYALWQQANLGQSRACFFATPVRR